MACPSSIVVHGKGLACRTVLMDTWYATKELMLFIESLGKIYYCPLKSNRLVDDSGGALAYRHVDSLSWSEREAEHGKVIKIKGFPKEHKVKLFRVAVIHVISPCVYRGMERKATVHAPRNPCYTMRFEVSASPLLVVGIARYDSSSRLARRKNSSISLLRY